MITHEEHIQKILSLVMFDNDHNYYLNQCMVDNIGLFKRKLDKVLNYYYLPVCADEIIIYERIKVLSNKDHTSSSYSSTESEAEQQLGRGYKL